MKDFIEIVDGPSKFDIMTSLFGTGNINSTAAPTFKLEEGTWMKIGIQQILREDSTGESWEIGGYSIGPALRKQVTGNTVKFYYNSKTRKGTIMLNVR